MTIKKLLAIAGAIILSVQLVWATWDPNEDTYYNPYYHLYWVIADSGVDNQNLAYGDAYIESDGSAYYFEVDVEGHLWGGGVEGGSYANWGTWGIAWYSGASDNYYRVVRAQVACHYYPFITPGNPVSGTPVVAALATAEAISQL